MSYYLDLTIVASFVILAISDLIAKFIRTMIDNKYEDLAKVKIDSYYLTKKYPLMKIIKENKYESDKVKYFPTVPIISRKMHEPAFNLDISDKPNSYYELPEQIKNRADHIMEAHNTSNVYNQICIRLNDISTKNNKVHLFTERTYFFDSLITNRASDYLLDNEKTIREIFEPGPMLNNLKTSKMSNHLGFNGLIVTSDDYLILINRNKKGLSISRNTLTTSVAASLKSKYALSLNESGDYVFTKEGLANAIRLEIKDELGISVDTSDEDILNGIFAFYRDLVEAGKPQFLFALKLDMTLGKFDDEFNKYTIQQKRQKSKALSDIMAIDGNKYVAIKLEDFVNKNQQNKVEIFPTGIRIDINGKEKKFKMQPSASGSLILFREYLG